MNNEIWHPAEGFKGIYEVSTKLRVRSVCRDISTQWSKRTIPQRIMRLRTLKDGTTYIKLQGRYYKVADLLPLEVKPE